MTLPAEHPAAGTRDSRQWGPPARRTVDPRRRAPPHPGVRGAGHADEELPCSLT